ncbi:MAG TPA: hypothetical protein VKZ53_09435 [Candidatus Angelobacter sp.]|nr:hypothetical protein [Candidatus Angelobacter sp.]
MSSTLMKLEVGETDDPYFIQYLASLVNGLLKKNSPKGLWIIQIDNWFDHRWLRFSGLGVVDFHFPAFMNLYDAALDEFYQDKLTFPPFTPNRILSQWAFARVGDHYVETPTDVPHRWKKQSSGENLHRRVQDFSRSGCFVWYSSNTVANGRGSVMVYTVADHRIECWFAGFKRHEEWKLHTTKGIPREEVNELLRAQNISEDEPTR